MTMSENTPCYGCTERWVKDGVSCHSVCPRYIEAVEAHQKRKGDILAAKKQDKLYREYQTNSAIRRKLRREDLQHQKQGRARH